MRPLDLGPRSSDEYAPLPRSPVVREAERRAAEAIGLLARRTGMTRREALRSAAASALVLAALAGCTKEERRATGKPDSGGTYRIPGTTAPPTAPPTTEPEAAEEVLDDPPPIVDVQLHFLDPAQDHGFGSNFPQSNCGLGPVECFSEAQFLDLVFEQSRTGVGVLSALPFLEPDSPLSLPTMDAARESFERLQPGGPERRLLLQAGIFPGAVDLPLVLDAMEAAVRDFPIVAWKTYTHAPGPYRLDDERGLTVLRKGVELGIPVLCVHKGLAGGDPDASPEDVGPAAAAVPEASIVAFHSGWDTGRVEGPYDPTAPPGSHRGIDRLLASVDAAGIPAGGNVYAELGTTWFNLARDPDQAAHALGKLLSRLGTGNVIWGTDSIWYGSPQGQIDAFLAFEISEEYQERYGYPALTPEVKQAVLGGNATRLLAA